MKKNSGGKKQVFNGTQKGKRILDFLQSNKWKEEETACKQNNKG